jgi:hypothetical protein
LQALLADPRFATGRAAGAAMRQPRPSSDDHFSVDGTLIEAWASMKSFRTNRPLTGRNGERHFYSEKRSNETHASTTDLDGRLYKKGDGQALKLIPTFSFFRVGCARAWVSGNIAVEAACRTVRRASFI